MPQIAHDLAVAPTTATLLTTAFAVPYAVVQPILGASADIFGKPRSLMVCLGIVVVAAILSALAPSFPALVAARVLFGIGSGGIFPISVAITADLVPIAGRQVAIARLLAASMTAIVLGAAGAGIVADFIGWRAVFVLTAIICGGALAATAQVFRRLETAPPKGRGLSTLFAGYRTLFNHPLAPICFGGVLVEGLLVFGFFPFVAILLRAQGHASAAIAGIVLGGWGLGGLIYSQSVSRMLRRIPERVMMMSGGTIALLAYVALAFGPPWPVAFVIFVFLGFGFYLLHGFIQLYVSELAPDARGSALSLHSAFFFVGQATGPLAFGFGLAHLGTAMTLVIAGFGMFANALICAGTLRRSAVAPDP